MSSIELDQVTASHEKVKAAANSPAKAELDKPDSDKGSPGSTEDAAKPVSVRIAKETSLRRVITYIMARVQAGATVTLQALTVQVHRAVNVASIVRDRVGNVHQVNSLLVVEESSKREGEEQLNARSTSGIQIVLSLSPLSDDEVGYQKPKPRGYAQSYLRRRNRQYDRGADGGRGVKQQTSNAPSKPAGDKAVKDQAPGTADGEKTRRRRKRGSTDADLKKSESQTDKNGQDRQVKADTEDTKSTKNRRRQSRRRSKTTDKVAEESKSEVQTKRERSRPDRDQKEDQKSQAQSRATSRQSNRRQKSMSERDAPPPQDYDVDHNGRRMPPQRDSLPYQSGNGRSPPQNHGRPYYASRGNPYQHGQSHRYMMGYHQNGRDSYFNQYDQGYGRNARPQQSYKMNQGGQGLARPGYYPASSRPRNPDQLMDTYDQPRRGGMQIGRRGGFSAASNY